MDWLGKACGLLQGWCDGGSQDLDDAGGLCLYSKDDGR